MLAALLHEPFGGGGGSADAHRLYVLEPVRLYFVGMPDKVGIGVHIKALREKHLPVAALLSRHKDDDIVLLRKAADIAEAVRHLPADGVEELKRQSLLIHQHILASLQGGVHPA